MENWQLNTPVSDDATTPTGVPAIKGNLSTKGKILTFFGGPAEWIWFEVLGNKSGGVSGLFQVMAITLLYWALVLYFVYKRKWSIVATMVIGALFIPKRQ